MNSPARWQRWKNIMKCYPFEEKRLAKWEPPYIVQPKYDGVRCRAVRLDNGEFILLSSEENIIHSVPHINIACNRQLTEEEYDGELYTHGMSFEEIISITSRTVNLCRDHRVINFHIFDIPSNLSQVERINEMKFVDMKPPLIKTPFWIAYNLEEVMKVYDKLINLGYEGIIVRHYLAPYERKRSLWVMKFKPKQEDEYEITNCYEEVSVDGVPKGTLGCIECLSGDGNTFRVGTGFTDEQRHELWDIRALLKGMVCKVQYQHITSGKKVPRFPVFVEIIP